MSLTFSLEDGRGVVGGVWVCVAVDILQTLLTDSEIGLRASTITEPAFWGLGSGCLSTVRKKTVSFLFPENFNDKTLNIVMRY